MVQLCFFLVEDGDADEYYDEVSFPGFSYRGMETMTVLTASDVPAQARPCNTPTLALLLGVAFRKVVGRHLPVELKQLILAETQGVDFGISREQAEQRRRALMADRRVQGGMVNDVSINALSLCAYITHVDYRLSTAVAGELLIVRTLIQDIVILLYATIVQYGSSFRIEYGPRIEERLRTEFNAVK
jgi:hypothetical protein